MTKIQKLKIVFLLFAFYFLFSGTLVHAANIFFEAKNQEFTQGEEFLASVFLNTEEEPVNAAEGRIVFPENLLAVKEIRDGNSIINFWIERPRIEQPGIIVFSGIIPGGYRETKGFVFSVVFRAEASGNGAIEIRDAKVLLNDGEGTPANVKISNFQFLISKQAPISKSQILVSEEDKDSPEEFKPEIAQSPEMFEGKYLLVFATQDKGSGIDYYAVRETRREINLQHETDAKWQTAESPYVLKDQEFKSYIYVKAVDKAGNERIVMLEPKYPIKWYKVWWTWIIIIAMILVGYMFWKILKSKIKNQNER